MNLKISIVIPTYNRAELLIKTIESALRQTYRNFEVVVVDDGSTDHTKERLEQFAARREFRYHFKKNEGRSAARNTGARLATGEWLLFLDSDDLLLEDALENLARRIPNNAAVGIVGGNAAFVDGNANIVAAAEDNALFNNVELNEDELIEPYRQLIRQVFLVTGSYIVRKTAFEASGGFDARLDICEDLDWLLRTAAANRVCCTAQAIVLIRNHGGNTNTDDIRRAAIIVGQAHLRRVVPRLAADLRSRCAAEWNLRIADEYYNLEQNRAALASYLRAAQHDRRLLSQNSVRRQILACLFPVALKKRVRRARGKSAS